MGKVVPMRPGDDGKRKRSEPKGPSKVVQLPSAEPEREPMLGPLSSLMDEAFADAVARGLMDDLPGKGQPLPDSFFREDDPYQPEATLDQRILSEAGLVPDWLKLRKQISVDLAWVRANRPDGGGAGPAESTGGAAGSTGSTESGGGARSGDPVYPDPTWAERVQQLNAAIQKFNRKCPPMMQIPLYRPEFDL